MKQRIVMVFSVFVCLFSLNNVFAKPEAHLNEAGELKKLPPPLVFFASTPKPVVTISLDACIACGYEWFMKDIQSDLIDAASYTFVSHTKPGVVGGSGQAVWDLTLDTAAFEVPQRIDVSFFYQRPWASRDYDITEQRVLIFTKPKSDNT